MTPPLTPPVPRPVPPLTPLTATRDNPMPIDALGERIAELAARIHAATYELLIMLLEFDEGRGWNNGFLSCAHWLNWRTGIDLGAAREKVRVARALPGLPRISAALALRLDLLRQSAGHHARGHAGDRAAAARCRAGRDRVTCRAHRRAPGGAPTA